MEHYELISDQEQRKNLKTLADYLSTGNTAMIFDMNVFNDIAKYSSDWNCGTVACAAGHGPAAGIEPLKDELWLSYIHRVFSYSELTYEWIFDDRWHHTDNTPEGAAKRIYYALENGIPENCKYQMRGINYIFKECSEVKDVKRIETHPKDVNIAKTVKWMNAAYDSISKAGGVPQDIMGEFPEKLLENMVRNNLYITYKKDEK